MMLFLLAFAEMILVSPPRFYHGAIMLTCSELESILSIPFNLAEKNLSEFDLYQGVGGEPYYQAVASLYLTWRDGSAKTTVKWKDNVIYSSDDS